MLFHNSITIINNNLVNKKKKFFLKNNKKTINLLNLFIKLNILKNFKKISKDLLQVEFFFFRGNPPIKKIKNYSLCKNKNPISFLKLKKTTKQAASIYILKTNLGFLTNYECILKKEGGILLLKLLF